MAAPHDPPREAGPLRGRARAPAPAGVPADPRVFRASALAARSVEVGACAARGDWPPRGCVIELAGGLDGACTSLAVAAVVGAQRLGDLVVWVQPRHGLLFPPDLAAHGADLDALVVVHACSAPGRSSRRGGLELPRAAELLLRAGAFDLVVLDLRPVPPARGAWLHRLQALARLHQTRVLLLGEASAPVEPASAVAQRVVVRRRRGEPAFVVEPQLLADKLHAPVHPPFHCAAPVGLS